MNRRDRLWLLGAALILTLAFALLALGHYETFHDARDLFFYLFLDVVFLPLQVLIVGLIIEQIVSLREKRAVAHKLNMVIGAFFSELGTPLLAVVVPAMTASPDIRRNLDLRASWKSDDFVRAAGYARSLKSGVDLNKLDLPALRDRLIAGRQFILRLLENPHLLEHDRFTDLLWAVHHLEEELAARSDLSNLHPADQAHLQVDILRALNALLSEWVMYTKHLKEDYPYLFSLVVRTHPFQDNPSPEIVD
jgi:hypothetical protein